ncbi:MAG: nuclear transport factor 2 family protein, partial [Syntrophales bacterium]
MKKNGRTLVAAACCLMLILTAGCAALSPAKEEPIEERVKNYMQAQMERKWDRAYEFFDSSSREKVARDSYVYRVRTVNFKAFKIENIEVLPSGDEATVKVRMDIPYMGYNFQGVSQMQTWVKEKGQWFVKSGF